MNWKGALKQCIPPNILNTFLLTFPFLYRTKMIRYEANQSKSETCELLQQLQAALSLEGDIAECGSSRAGGSIFMANLIHAQGICKTIYAFDSFQGFDPVELAREKKSGLTATPENSFTSTSYQYVTKKIKILGLKDTIVPVQGYFQDTLPKFDRTLCFAFIDCDLKDSLIYCAKTLWPKLVYGGRIVFHDYTSQDYRGARLGTDEFVRSYSDQLAEHGLRNGLYYIIKN